MRFEQALEAMRAGAVVSYPFGAMSREYRLSRGYIQQRIVPQTPVPQWGSASHIQDYEMLGEDWRIAAARPKLYPFSVALELARAEPTARIRRHISMPQRYRVTGDELYACGGRHDGRLAELCGEALGARDWVVERPAAPPPVPQPFTRSELEDSSTVYSHPRHGRWRAVEYEGGPTGWWLRLQSLERVGRRGGDEPEERVLRHTSSDVGEWTAVRW